MTLSSKSNFPSDNALTSYMTADDPLDFHSIKRLILNNA